MTKINQLILVFATSTIILLNIFIISGVASAPPPLPNAFISGNVEIDGVDAPVGTVVYAYIDIANDTVADGSVTITTTGHYENLAVTGTAEDHEKEITFKIGNITAAQTAKFSIYSPNPAVLDLSDTGSLLVNPEESTVFKDTTAPEDKEVAVVTEVETESSAQEKSNGLDGFTFIIGTIGLLLAVFITKYKGDI